MPKKSLSSSSSSSDEDLAAFQSVAVSFEEIVSKQKDIAEQAKQRIAGSTKRKKGSKKKSTGQGEDGAALDQESGGEDDDGPWDQLNPIQLKVAAALDGLLDGRLRLKAPGPKKLRREARSAAERAEAEVCVDAEPSNGSSSGGGFRFFARVTPGEPVVMQPEEPPPPARGTPFPDVFRDRRTPAEDEAAAALPLLAVDGATVLAGAAAAAAAAAAHSPATDAPVQQRRRQELHATEVKTKREKKSAQSNRLDEGTVIDPRVFVSHDDRIRRLVGSTTAAPAGQAA